MVKLPKNSFLFILCFCSFNIFSFIYGKDWSCFDKSVCKNFYCSNDEAAHRAGNLCYDFPYYNGGYPIGRIAWDEGKNQYTCTKGAANAEYCEEWEEFENSGSKSSLGKCFCQETSPNQKYCYSWRCIQTQTYKCSATEYTSGTSCCHKDNGRTICTPMTVKQEYTDCSCSENSTSTEYCSDWKCNAILSGQSSVQNENYTCQVADSGRKFCQSWKGDVESTKLFGFSLCDCFAYAINRTYCKQWLCSEKELNYQNPNLAMSAMSILVGGMGLVAIDIMLYVYAKLSPVSIAVVILGFLWMFGFLLLGIFLAGFWIFIITIAVWVPVWLIVDLVILVVKTNRSVIGKIFRGLFFVCCGAIDCSDFEFPSCSCPTFSRENDEEEFNSPVAITTPEAKEMEAVTVQKEEDLEPPSYNEAVGSGA